MPTYAKHSSVHQGYRWTKTDKTPFSELPMGQEANHKQGINNWRLGGRCEESQTEYDGVLVHLDISSGKASLRSILWGVNSHAEAPGSK